MESPRILVMSSDEELIDHVLGLAAAHGVEVHVASDPGAARGRWQSARLVLIGADHAHAACDQELPRRSGVVIVCTEDDDTLWQTGVALGAEHVVHLPEGERWLLDRLAQAIETPRSDGAVISVLPASGGAGASTFAVTTARCLARQLRTVVIDADAIGGGLELVMGLEDAEGVRWADLADTRGRLSPATLADALPKTDAVSVLSWSRFGPTTLVEGAFASVVDAAIKAFDVVVIDLPRDIGADGEYALSRSTRACVVATTRIRSVFAAGRILEQVTRQVSDTRLVVRSDPRGVGPDVITQAVGQREAARLPFSARLATLADSGELPSLRDPYARACRAFVSSWSSDEHQSTRKAA